MFVVVIMTIASTRPVLCAAEWFMSLLAGLGKRKPRRGGYRSSPLGRCSDRLSPSPPP
jgi:hypothetical protein